ncbi:aspartate--tRNA(Asn) ligase, partial [Candidatus Parvarchaeota archaeon]|nr:aspartate--tRNA(Asn) ligase [Candidatus Parvarchaeota archaeon]
MFRTNYIEEAKGLAGKEITLAGWVHEVRNLGKLRFLQLRDRTGIIQVTGKEGVTPPQVLQSMDLVKETVVRIEGNVVESKIAKAGIEFSPTKIEVLGEVTRKVPFEVTGKVPVELDVRLDYRYVDLRRAAPSAIFRIKHEAVTGFRETLCQMGFQEVQPTSIVAAATEGGTNLFPIEYFERKAYLAQSPQLYKQLAVVGGIDKVFMTTPAFRAEKHNTLSHLNEVLQMDIEMGFADHNDAMDTLEKVVLSILARVEAKNKIELEALGAKVSVPKKIKRYTYTQLIELLNKNGVKIEWGEDFSRETEAELYKLLSEELYFITEWPTAIRAFYSMPQEGNEKVCNAYDLMYKGTEISSGAQRIHVPGLLIRQLEARGLDPTDFEFYINAFRVGAPPHAGWSIGLERITMKICD